MMQGKTVIEIALWLSTIARMDLIIVLRKKKGLLRKAALIVSC